MFVQNIEETVGETPKEEEDGDEGDGDDGLSGGDLRGASDGPVTDTLPPSLKVKGFGGGWSSLATDFVNGWFDLLAEHLVRRMEVRY